MLPGLLLKDVLWVFFQARSASDEKGDPTLLEMFLSRGCDEATAVVMALDMVSYGFEARFFALDAHL